MRHKLSLIILFSVLCSLFLVLGSQCSAQETLTITTYYPSPYGSYNQLQTNSLGVGDNDADGSLDSGDVPPTTPTTGNVWIRGNVGIGLTNPARKLDIMQTTDDINNGIGILNAASTSRLNLYKVGDTGYIYSGGSGQLPLILSGTGNVGIGTANPSGLLQVGPSPAPGLVVTAAGNVGIGTTAPTPGSKLEVLNASAGTTLRISTQDATHFSEEVLASLEFYHPNANGTGWNSPTQLGYIRSVFTRLCILGGCPEDDAGLTFGTLNYDNQFPQERMRIKADGNVGIGTTIPLARLHVLETAVAKDVFRVDDQFNDTTPFIINQNGDVGIGTTNPSYRLEVNGTTQSTRFEASASSSTTRYFSDRIEIDGTGDFNIQNVNPLAPMNVNLPTGMFGPTNLSVSGKVNVSGSIEVSQNKMVRVGNAYLSSGGNYAHLATNEWLDAGVWNATAPGLLFQLDRNANARIYQHNGAGVHTEWAYVSGTSGWQASSSRKYKQNVKRLTDNDYEELRKKFQALNLFSFNRIDTPGEKEMGFIAEDSPDLILGEDKTRIPYIKAIGYLAAIDKAQENTILSLQKQIDVLKAELRELKRKNGL